VGKWNRWALKSSEGVFKSVSYLQNILRHHVKDKHRNGMLFYTAKRIEQVTNLQLTGHIANSAQIGF